MLSGAAHRRRRTDAAAQTLLRPGALPLDRLQLRLRLKDRQLTLDPFNVGLAGGPLRAQVRLDGRAEPLQGRATLQLRGAQRAQLFPTVDLRKASVGRLDGDAELSGQGASVGRLLATASGRVSLVALALGLLNPWLVLVPLIEAGPGADSPCAVLVRDAQARGTAAPGR